MKSDNRMFYGIDPGKDGAIVGISGDGTVIKKFVMPKIGKLVNAPMIVNELKVIATACPKMIVIEDVHAIYGSSAGSTFEFGFVCGLIHGIVTAMKMPYVLVQPKAWQAQMYKGIPEIRKPSIQIQTGKRAGKMIKGKLETKKMSLVAAQRMFPSLDLRANDRCRIPHDGIVDALLMAEYCRRMFQ